MVGIAGRLPAGETPAAVPLDTAGDLAVSLLCSGQAGVTSIPGISGAFVGCSSCMCFAVLAGGCSAFTDRPYHRKGKEGCSCAFPDINWKHQQNECSVLCFSVHCSFSGALQC